MNKKSNFGWSELIIGLLMTVLGIITFIKPENILSGAIIVYGIIITIMGIDDIIVYARVSRFTGFGPTLALISGILSVMCGIMLIANPNIGKWALTIFMPIWFIAHSIAGLTRTNFIRLVGNTFYYYFSLILNILGLIIGCIMIFSPAMSFLTLRVGTYIVAAYFVLFGIENIISVFVRRNSDW